jgi:dihydrofolate reductase
MGRVTWESLPAKSLPGRLNIVVSKTRRFSKARDVLFARDLPHALQISEHRGFRWVIGGEVVFHQAVPLASRMCLTHVEEVFGCDRFFPEFAMEDWSVGRSTNQHERRDSHRTRFLDLYRREQSVDMAYFAQNARFLAESRAFL